MRATKDVKEMLLELKHSYWLPPFSVRARAAALPLAHGPEARPLCPCLDRKPVVFRTGFALDAFRTHAPLTAAARPTSLHRRRTACAPPWRR